jgi:hypothetical protein
VTKRIKTFLNILYLGIIVSSCSTENFEHDFSNYLNNQKDFETFHVISYNKFPSKNYFKTRYKPLIDKNLLIADSSFKDNETFYTLNHSHLSKNLLIDESNEKLIFICGKIKFHSIQSVEKSSDENFYKVLSKYVYINKSSIFLNDPFRLVGDPEKIEDAKYVSFLVKKNWFGFDIEPQDNSIFIKEL